MKVGFISLGCSKNLVDTEMTIGLFKEHQYDIVNDTNEIISSKAISPKGNLSNIVTNDNGLNIVEKFGKNHVIMKNPIVTTPAIIWFSVILDANIPNDTYAILNKKNPSNVTSAVCTCGVPKRNRIARYINVHNSVMKTTNKAAKNFPNTIPVMLLGDV